MVQMSQGGLFHAAIESDVSPIPLNKAHSWRLKIEAQDGSPVDDADISVVFGIPANKNNTVAKSENVQNMGRGKFIIEGVIFTMPGQWEIWINIVVASRQDKVVFSFNIPSK